MAVIELPKRPGVANPARKTEQMEKAMSELDEQINILFCVYATLAGSEDVPDEPLEVLIAAHKRLRLNCDKLFALL